MSKHSPMSDIEKKGGVIKMKQEILCKHDHLNGVSVEIGDTMQAFSLKWGFYAKTWKSKECCPEVL